MVNPIYDTVESDLQFPGMLREPATMELSTGIGQISHRRKCQRLLSNIRCYEALPIGML